MLKRLLALPVILLAACTPKVPPKPPEPPKPPPVVEGTPAAVRFAVNPSRSRSVVEVHAIDHVPGQVIDVRSVPFAPVSSETSHAPADGAREAFSCVSNVSISPAPMPIVER
jgi:hypothetical protein